MGLGGILGIDTNTSTSATSTSNAGSQQVGNTQQGASAIGASAANGGTISITQDSPSAIAALQKGTKDALDAVTSIAQGTTDQAAKQVNSALKTAANATQPASITTAKFLVWAFGIAGAVALGLAALIFGRGKSGQTSKSGA